METEKFSMCPFIQGPCVQDQCTQWVNVKGADPQTGEKFDKWACSVSHWPQLMIENSKYERDVSIELHALSQIMDKSIEMIMEASGRSDLLIQWRARRDHIRALTRTQELNSRPQVPVPADS